MAKSKPKSKDNAQPDSDTFMEVTTADAIQEVFQSPNVIPHDGLSGRPDPVNIVEVLDNLAHGVHKVAEAIIPARAAGNEDATGSHVSSLTEAAMGITRGLIEISHALNNVADAILATKSDD